MSASFSGTSLGAEHRRENLLRKSSLEFCSYRLCSNHYEKNPFMHPDNKSPKNPLMKVAHNKPTAIWLMNMTVQCTWCEERLYVDLYTSFCWTLQKFAMSVM